MAKNGGFRNPPKKDMFYENEEFKYEAQMDGSKVMEFTLDKVPMSIKEILEQSNEKVENIDYFIMHQANKFIMFHNIMSVYRRHSCGIWAKGVEKSENLLAQFPLQIVNFYYSVYKIITDSSQAYLNEQFYPNLNTILDACYRRKKFKDLQLIYDKYKQYIDNIDNVGAENSQKVLKKNIENIKNYLILL